MSKSSQKSDKSLQDERLQLKRTIRQMYEKYILLERDNRNLMSEITNNENYLNYVLENTKSDANNFLTNLQEMANGDVKPRFGLEDPFIKKHLGLILNKFEAHGYKVKYVGICFLFLRLGKVGLVDGRCCLGSIDKWGCV